MTERHRLASNKCNSLKLSINGSSIILSRHGINIHEVWYIEVLEPVGGFWQTLLGVGKVGDGGKSSYSINFSSSSTQ